MPKQSNRRSTSHQKATLGIDTAGCDRLLPYGRQQVDESDVEAVAQVLRSDWLTTGPMVARFEEALADLVGARHAVACSSGTAGLHLAMLALGLDPDDRVVVPSVTFLATANAARYVGAEVVFADVDPATGLMGPEELEAALGRDGEQSVRAVVPVHLGGQTANLEMLSQIARRCGAALVEDACHALGSEYRGTDGGSHIGSGRHSRMSVFSFHPVKTVTAGEGGAVVTNDDRLADNLRRFRNHGIINKPGEDLAKPAALAPEERHGPWYYEMAELGFNYRLSDIHCALATSQLARLDEFVARRRGLVELYDERIAPLAPIVKPAGRVSWCDPAWHLYAVRIRFSEAGIDRSSLMKRLSDRGIGTQVHYIPVHRQPYYQDRYGALSLPGADAYYANTLSLPLFPAMRDSDVDRVVGAIEKILDEAGRA